MATMGHTRPLTAPVTSPEYRHTGGRGGCHRPDLSSCSKSRLTAVKWCPTPRLRSCPATTSAIACGAHERRHPRFRVTDSAHESGRPEVRRGCTGKRSRLRRSGRRHASDGLFLSKPVRNPIVTVTHGASVDSFGPEQREVAVAGAVARSWEADPETTFLRRIGKSPQELGVTPDTPDCPDMWELGNGDVAVIGRDLTSALGTKLPVGVSIGPHERLVVIPRSMLIAARPDIPSV